MSGLIRNFITIIYALLARGTFNGQSRIASYYWVTPFDCGTRVLKSDKYLQFAESAQLDFLVKTKLFDKLLRNGIAFVNASQLVKFMRPIGIFARVRVETLIVYSDEKCAYFSHSLFVGDEQRGEVLVKMKFKKGSITVRPTEIVGPCPSAKPVHIEKWDQMLAGMP
jgi:acyl-CoA thioesterase FadM